MKFIYKLKYLIKCYRVKKSIKFILSQFNSNDSFKTLDNMGIEDIVEPNCDNYKTNLHKDNIAIIINKQKYENKTRNN